jgi:hypothetical protein
MDYPDDYPPPDPDGRPSIRIDFNLGGELPELDLGTGGASIGSIREQQLELSERLQVVLFEDEGDEWMLVDAIVDRFISNAMVAGSYASIGRRFAAYQSPVARR